MQYFWLLSGLYMGWSLGVNDPSHIFGTAYITNMLKWKTIATLLCVFIIIGALLQGKAGLETLGSLSKQTNLSAFIYIPGYAGRNHRYRRGESGFKL